MRMRTPGPANAAQVSTLASESSGIVQRKCACGGKTGPSETCEECQKELSQVRSPSETAEQLKVPPLVLHTMQTLGHSDFASITAGETRGHNFGNVRVEQEAPRAALGGILNALPAASRETAWAPRKSPVLAMTTQEGCGCSVCARQESSDREERARATSERPPEEDTEPLMVDGVVGTAAVPCYGGGGGSSCNPSTGVYDILYNRNTCCTKDCTQQHEQQHVTDLQPCCQKLSAKVSGGGDRNTLVGQFNTWMGSGASAWSECNAYKVSISCGEALRTSNKCDSTKSTCCDEIDDYLTNARSQKSSYCGSAPGSLPACPF